MTKRYGLVKWIGRSIFICGIEVFIKPPYDSNSVFGKDVNNVKEIKSFFDK